MIIMERELENMLCEKELKKPGAHGTSIKEYKQQSHSINRLTKLYYDK